LNWTILSPLTSSKSTVAEVPVPVKVNVPSGTFVPELVIVISVMSSIVPSSVPLPVLSVNRSSASVGLVETSVTAHSAGTVSIILAGAPLYDIIKEHY